MSAAVFSGVLVQLRFPYPRGVSEPAIYLEANVVSDAVAEADAQQLKPPNKGSSSKLLNSLDLSVSSLQ